MDREISTSGKIVEIEGGWVTLSLHWEDAEHLAACVHNNSLFRSMLKAAAYAGRLQMKSLALENDTFSNCPIDVGGDVAI